MQYFPVRICDFYMPKSSIDAPATLAAAAAATATAPKKLSEKL
jgi:hypothetical protein